VLYGRYPEKLDFFKRAGGKTVWVEENAGNLNFENSEKMFNAVIEATGRPDGLNTAISLVAPGGTVFVKTTTPQDVCINLSQIVVNEIKLVGSRCGDIADALAWLENKKIDVKGLVDGMYPFSDFMAAFEHARRRGSKKVLITHNA